VKETIDPAGVPELQRAIAAFLNTHGWSVLVAGEFTVEQQPKDIGTANYTFTMRFTGGRPFGKVEP